MFSFENELHALFLFVKIKKCAQIPRKSLVNKKKFIFCISGKSINKSIIKTKTYCSFNLVVGRKILWYFKLKILRGL
jgi:hypothetical protein